MSNLKSLGYKVFILLLCVSLVVTPVSAFGLGEFFSSLGVNFGFPKFGSVASGGFSYLVDPTSFPWGSPVMVLARNLPLDVTGYDFSIQYKDINGNFYTDAIDYSIYDIEYDSNSKNVTFYVYVFPSSISVSDFPEEYAGFECYLKGNFKRSDGAVTYAMNRKVDVSVPYGVRYSNPRDFGFDFQGYCNLYVDFASSPSALVDISVDVTEPLYLGLFAGGSEQQYDILRTLVSQVNLQHERSSAVGLTFQVAGDFSVGDCEYIRIPVKTVSQRLGTHTFDVVWWNPVRPVGSYRFSTNGQIVNYNYSKSVIVPSGTRLSLRPGDGDPNNFVHWYIRGGRCQIDSPTYPWTMVTTGDAITTVFADTTGAYGLEVMDLNPRDTTISVGDTVNFVASGYGHDANDHNVSAPWYRYVMYKNGSRIDFDDDHVPYTNQNFSVTFPDAGDFVLYAQSDSVQSNDVIVHVVGADPVPDALELQFDKSAYSSVEPVTFTTRLYNTSTQESFTGSGSLYVNEALYDIDIGGSGSISSLEVGDYQATALVSWQGYAISSEPKYFVVVDSPHPTITPTYAPVPTVLPIYEVPSQPPPRYSRDVMSGVSWLNFSLTLDASNVQQVHGFIWGLSIPTPYDLYLWMRGSAGEVNLTVSNTTRLQLEKEAHDEVNPLLFITDLSNAVVGIENQYVQYVLSLVRTNPFVEMWPSVSTILNKLIPGFLLNLASVIIFIYAAMKIRGLFK